MDNFPEDISPEAPYALSYDDSVPYEEQIQPEPSENNAISSLANRLGSARVYLLSESTATTRVGKRKHGSDDENSADEEEGMSEDTSYRTNAFLLQGSPISYLPTARIFAYATHFDTKPMGLEWVDDNTCVLVFKSTALARSGHRNLQKSATEEPDTDGFITARPIPVALWPPEKRINSSLGMSEGLKGVIRMRWALQNDVKKKGANKESEFYRRHGVTAGKELFDGRDLPPVKRSRHTHSIDEEEKRAQLDNELDEFLAENDSDSGNPPSPPSKMRSDYIASDGRTLLERTSLIRIHSPVPLESRLADPPPQRRRNQKYPLESDSSHFTIPQEKLEWKRRAKQEKDSGRRRGRGGGSGRPERTERPRKTQQELDDELDAFLKKDE